MRIAVDAMGGDNAPGAIIEGALLALERHADMEITLLGRMDDMKAVLGDRNPDRVTLVDCPSVIETGEDPLRAIRAKKDSSMVQGQMPDIAVPPFILCLPTLYNIHDPLSSRKKPPGDRVRPNKKETEKAQHQSTFIS